MTKLMSFHLKNTKLSSQGWGQRKQEALLIAELGAMPILEYERTRNTAAKQLKCRVSWFDRTIEAIRIRINNDFADLPPPKD